MDIKKLMVASALLMSMTTMAQTGKGGTWTLDDCLNYAIKNNISLQRYWIEATTNQQKFRSAQVSVESQQASYDLLSEQFNLGLKNIVELMTGKTNLLNAQQEKLQSKYMTILDIQMLKFYASASSDASTL